MASRRNCLPVCRRHARRYRTKKYCQEPLKSRWQYVYALAKAKARQSVHCLLRTVFHLKIHIRRWLVSHVNHPLIHPSLQPLASLSFYLSLSVRHFVYLSPSILSTSMSVFLSVNVRVTLPVCLSVYPLLCTSVCPSSVPFSRLFPPP